MRRLLFPALALAAATVSRPAAAETAYTITETLIGEWLWDNGNGEPNDDYYWDIKNRLNIGIRGEGLDAGLRVDTGTFRFFYPNWMGDETDEERAERERAWYLRHGVEPDEQGEYGHVGDYRLERAYATVDLARDWRLTGGDFYAHIGRGLVLSLRKEDELGLDSALRGGRLDGRLLDRVDLTLMGGLVNVTNVDERFNLVSEDPLDVISAARVAVDLWEGNRVSLHVMDMSPHRDDATLENLVAYGGALEFVDLPYDLQLYAELDGLHRENMDAASDDAFAAYMDASGIFGPVQLGLEYKEYHDFAIVSTESDALNVNWPYNRPPIADQEDQLIESEYDVRGGRARVEWQVADWLVLLAACAGSQDLSDAGHDAVHAYGGFEIYWDEGQSVLRGTAGYRHAWGDTLTGGTETYRTLVHAKVDLSLHVWGPLSLQANVLHEEWSRSDLGIMYDYRRGTTALSLDWAGIGGVFGTFEYDTEDARAEHWFGAGGLQWFALDWLTVRARAGSQRGGRKCLAGVCREFPPFDGVRLELIFRI